MSNNSYQNTSQIKFNGRQNANNASCGFLIFQLIGWGLIAYSLFGESGNMLIYGILILVITTIIKNAAKQNGTPKNEIRSGTIQNSKNNAPVSAVMGSSESERPFYEKYENGNECPICKSLSANGFCIYCGFKFK